VLDYTAIESRHAVDFRGYFADALADLRGMEADGLAELRSDGMRVTAAGRCLLRAVAMPFDAYLRQAAAEAALPRYSRVV
jgi:oxygen-independent coproporphyrinogen-3 oxidase